MRQSLVFALGSRSRHLLPGIQSLFAVLKTKPRNFEIINFSCVISRNIRPGSEFIFEVLWAESIVYFLACHILLDCVHRANHIPSHLCALHIQLVCVPCFATSVGIPVLCLTDIPK